MPHLDNFRKDKLNILQAKKILEKEGFDYVILDLQLPMREKSPNAQVEFGMRLLDFILENYPSLGIVVVSAYGKDTFNIVDVMKRRQTGASISFVAKPFNEAGNTKLTDEILVVLEETKRIGNTKKKSPDLIETEDNEPCPPEIDQIDLICDICGNNRFKIKANGKSVEISQQMLNILVVFGRAQAVWKRNRLERYKASASHDQFNIGEKDDHNLSSAFSKLRKRLKGFLKNKPAKSIGDGRWILGAIIKNLKKGEKHSQI